MINTFAISDKAFIAFLLGLIAYRTVDLVVARLKLDQIIDKVAGVLPQHLTICQQRRALLKRTKQNARRWEIRAILIRYRTIVHISSWYEFYTAIYLLVLFTGLGTAVFVANYMEWNNGVVAQYAFTAVNILVTVLFSALSYVTENLRLDAERILLL